MLAELETLAGREVEELGTAIRAPGITLEQACRALVRRGANGGEGAIRRPSAPVLGAVPLC
jgi:hypothetical protein